MSGLSLLSEYMVSKKVGPGVSLGVSFLGFRSFGVFA